VLESKLFNANRLIVMRQRTFALWMRQRMGWAVAGALCAASAATGCGSKTDTQPQFPYGIVNLSFDLTNQQYRALRTDGGAITFPTRGPEGPAGVKGVIVVRQNAQSYLAFERNCPFQPYDACALVSLDRSSRLFLRDSCCNSQFDLRGQVTGGPAIRPLVQYSVSLQGTQLSVVN
jgi:nitrite reductase/ring-hydroxylating ferredoxin subunit